MTPVEIESQLMRYIGTNDYHAHWAGGGKLVYTDGVRAMAEMCGAYWLVDEIMIAQHDPKIRAYARQDAFQVWRLKPTMETGCWGLRMDNGDGGIFYYKEFELSDFPLEEGIKLYLQSVVLMLPSEY